MLPATRTTAGAAILARAPAAIAPFAAKLGAAVGVPAGSALLLALTLVLALLALALRAVTSRRGPVPNFAQQLAAQRSAASAAQSKGKAGATTAIKTRYVRLHVPPRGASLERGRWLGHACCTPTRP